jgi:phospholipid/cholesterol/gamma-HCH transport system ATP-binding protein
MKTLIELKNVNLFSGDFPVLMNISVKIPAEQSTIIMGPSGCGKSTLLKILAGIIIPDGGKVFIEGKDYYSLSEKEILLFKKKNGFVFQDSALWANKNVYENLSLPLRFHYPELTHKQIEQKVKKALNYINLIDSMYLRPAQLSIGERKMVSFIRAIITEPSIIYMDEPTLSVDNEMKGKLLSLVKKLKDNKSTIIAVIHESGITSMIADNLIILKSGIILAQGAFNDIINSKNDEIKNILAEVVKKPSSYDTDILDLLNE